MNGDRRCRSGCPVSLIPPLSTCPCSGCPIRDYSCLCCSGCSGSGFNKSVRGVPLLYDMGGCDVLRSASPQYVRAADPRESKSPWGSQSAKRDCLFH